MNKKWHKYLVYLSLVFLLIALYQADYLKIPQIHSYPLFLGAIVLLFVGFVVQAYAWQASLKSAAYQVAFKDCIAGMGLSIFTKFIPGKVLIIVGRAGYIQERYKYSLSELSALSLNAQIIELWVGLSIGSIAIMVLNGFEKWRWVVFLLWLALNVAIFSKLAHQIVEKILKLILKKEIHLPQLSAKAVFKVSPYFAAYWLIWSLAFVCFINALQVTNVPLIWGLGFALATPLGIMAIFTPGGIGIREGVMASFLVLAGMEIASATTVAVSSRLWFLIGETSIFLLAFLVHSTKGSIAAKQAGNQE